MSMYYDASNRGELSRIREYRVSAKDSLRTVCIKRPDDMLKMCEKNKAHPHFRIFNKYKYG